MDIRKLLADANVELAQTKKRILVNALIELQDEVDSSDDMFAGEEAAMTANRIFNMLFPTSIGENDAMLDELERFVIRGKLERDSQEPFTGESFKGLPDERMIS